MESEMDNHNGLFCVLWKESVPHMLQKVGFQIIAAKNIFKSAHVPKQDLLLINRTIKQNIQLFRIHVVACNKEIISKKLIRRYIQRVCNVDK